MMNVFSELLKSLVWDYLEILLKTNTYGYCLLEIFFLVTLLWLPNKRARRDYKCYSGSSCSVFFFQNVFVFSQQDIKRTWYVDPLSFLCVVAFEPTGHIWGRNGFCGVTSQLMNTNGTYWSQGAASNKLPPTHMWRCANRETEKNNRNFGVDLREKKNQIHSYEPLPFWKFYSTKSVSITIWRLHTIHIKNCH